MTSGSIPDDSGAEICSVFGNWWITTWSARNQPSDTSVTRKLDCATLGSNRCLITLEAYELDRCYLVSKSIQPEELSMLRYAWGKNIRPNELWNMFYLREDLHRSFDRGVWALVPDEDLVDRICEAIQSELIHRQKEGITGPWKDLDIASWSHKDGYDYTFVPLTLEEEDIIITRRDKDIENNPSRRTLSLHDPPYPNIPALRCHVHPYAVIKDAYPKLVANKARLSKQLVKLMGSLGIIYQTWEEAEQEAASRLVPPSTISSRTTQTGTVAGGPGTGRSAPRSEEHPGTNDDPAGQGDPTHSGSNSGGRGLFEEDSCSLPSVLTSENLPSCQDDMTPFPAYTSSFTGVQAKFPEIDTTVRLPKNSHQWILGVEAAREQGELVEMIDRSPALEKYATEEARVVPTQDWHSWTSKFALWYTPIPANRGVFSCNDWVEFKGYPPLTRALGEDE